MIILQLPAPVFPTPKFDLGQGHQWLESAGAIITLFVFAFGALVYLKGMMAKPTAAPTSTAAASTSASTHVFMDGPLTELVKAVNAVLTAFAQLPVLIVDNSRLRGEFDALKREMADSREKDRNAAQLEYDDIRDKMEIIRVDVTRAETRASVLEQRFNSQPRSNR